MCRASFKFDASTLVTRLFGYCKVLSIHECFSRLTARQFKPFVFWSLQVVKSFLFLLLCFNRKQRMSRPFMSIINWLRRIANWVRLKISMAIHFVQKRETKWAVNWSLRRNQMLNASGRQSVCAFLGTCATKKLLRILFTFNPSC